MKRFFLFAAAVVLVSVGLLLISSCKLDTLEKGVPAGVTVTIPAGL